MTPDQNILSFTMWFLLYIFNMGSNFQFNVLDKAQTVQILEFFQACTEKKNKARES